MREGSLKAVSRRVTQKVVYQLRASIEGIAVNVIGWTCGCEDEFAIGHFAKFGPQETVAARFTVGVEGAELGSHSID